VFFREWGDGGSRVFAAEGLVEEEEVGEAAADGEGGLLEGLEIRLWGGCGVSGVIDMDANADVDAIVDVLLGTDMGRTVVPLSILGRRHMRP